MERAARGKAWNIQQAGEVIVEGLRFPEGAFWSARDGCVYFVEWGGDTIWRVRDGRAAPLFGTEPGGGPCGLCQDREGNLWVCMYSSLKLVQVSPSGDVLQAIDGYAGQRFKGPNDLVIDARGGIYFTDSGDFEEDWTTGRAAGAVYYLTPEGRLLQVASKLHYPNGIALSLDGRTLIVNEHRKNRLLQYHIDPGGTLGDQRVFFGLDDDCLLAEDMCYELGPDGMCRDDRGNLWVAHYGGGKVVGVSPEGELLGKIHLARGRKPTNTAFDASSRALYVTEGELGLVYRISLEWGDE